MGRMASWWIVVWTAFVAGCFVLDPIPNLSVSEGGICYETLDCEGALICEDSTCTDGFGSCASSNDFCTGNVDCCSGVCTVETSRCADSCSSDSSCVSDCCLALEGGGAACYPSSFCVD